MPSRRRNGQRESSDSDDRFPNAVWPEPPISKSPVPASTRRSWTTTSTLLQSISEESQTRTPVGIVRSDRLRALATAEEIEDRFDASYRRPVYLSHSLAKAVRLLRKSSQSSGISNLI